MSYISLSLACLFGFDSSNSVSELWLCVNDIVRLILNFELLLCLNSILNLWNWELRTHCARLKWCVNEKKCSMLIKVKMLNQSLSVVVKACDNDESVSEFKLRFLKPQSDIVVCALFRFYWVTKNFSANSLLRMWELKSLFCCWRLCVISSVST